MHIEFNRYQVSEPKEQKQEIHMCIEYPNANFSNWLCSNSCFFNI